MIKTRSGKDTSLKFHPTTYYKITNKNECHHGFQYVNGLNIDTNKFQEKGSCCSGGLYFTDKEHILEFWKFGKYMTVQCVRCQHIAFAALRHLV